MAKSDTNPKITLSQLSYIFIQSQVGVDILNLSTVLHKEVGADGWISLLIGGAISIVFVLMMVHINKCYPGEGLFDVLRSSFGKTLGNVAGFGYYVYFLVVAIYLLTSYGELINQWLLPETPIMVLYLLLLISALYTISGGLTVIAKVFTFFAVILFVISVLFLFGFVEAKFIYLLPIGQASLSAYIEGIRVTIYSLSSYVLLLLFLPYTQGSIKQKTKTLIGTNLIVIFFYLYTVIVSYAHFGSDQIEHVSQPVLYMLRTADSVIITRIDIFVLSLWTVFAMTAFAAYLYGAERAFAQIPKSKKKMLNIYTASIIVLAVSFWGGLNEENIRSIIDFQDVITEYFTIYIPILLFLLSFLRRKDKKKEAAQ
ncbi:spore germination protein (amino acid permease) [Terribacillus halophilus]|uniref:Spore germination protein (Amino acid permease) n=1 Tax=Terribacillus halophilus TaxID=361279 RepID=A0A1G6WIZ4_9BACI|nr:GerAB/ArcD/ProY family transporter [Terribacillus halophilus]SDD65045.1 spore germination protein (amino acid permease) [Terribacillus halophilus]